MEKEEEERIVDFAERLRYVLELKITSLEWLCRNQIRLLKEI
jgi:hypothetical protein